MDVLKKGDLKESCLCLDAHYIVMGEKIYRVNLEREVREASLYSCSAPLP